MNELWFRAEDKSNGQVAWVPLRQVRSIQTGPPGAQIVLTDGTVFFSSEKADDIMANTVDLSLGRTSG